MTRKQKSYKELETENTRGKKRYLERIIEDKEADQRLKEFLEYPEQEDEYDKSIAQRPFS